MCEYDYPFVNQEVVMTTEFYIHYANEIVIYLHFKYYVWKYC